MLGIGRRLALSLLLAALVAPDPLISAPIDIKLDIVELLTVVGNWVSGIVADNRAQTDKRIKESIPALVTKMSVLAGQKQSLAASLSERIAGDDREARRLNAQLALINESLKDIGDLINSADPQFGGAHPELVTLLSMTIDEKIGLVQRATNRVNLLDPGVRTRVAEILKSEAQKLQDVALKLSSALTRS
jgi:hypothetical protein